MGANVHLRFQGVDIRILIPAIVRGSKQAGISLYAGFIKTRLLAIEAICPAELPGPKRTVCGPLVNHQKGQNFPGEI